MPSWKTRKFILFDTYLISYTKFQKYHFGVLEYLYPEGANCHQNLCLGGQWPSCPHCSKVGGLNKKVLPSTVQYLACDNIAKKLGGCIIITNCNKSLLQIMTAKLLQITRKFYYNLQQLIFYKLRQFYYKL